MKLPPFEYVAPGTPQEVVTLLGTRPGEAKIIAGGQSLLPTMAFRLARPSLLVDVRRLEGLRRITIDDSGVCLGARTRWRDIEDDRRLDVAHPRRSAPGSSRVPAPPQRSPRIPPPIRRFRASAAHAGQNHVIDEAAFATEQPKVFAALDTLADGASLTGLSTRCMHE